MLAKKLSRLSSVLIALCLGSLPAFCQQFSADMIRQKPEGTQPSKVAVKGEKIRFAMTGQQPQQESVVVIDLKQETGFMVLPDNKSYTPLASKHISTAMPFFLPTDPEMHARIGISSSASRVAAPKLATRRSMIAPL